MHAYRWSGSATGRGLSLSSSICIYVLIDKFVYMRTYVYIVRVCVYIDMFIYVYMYVYVYMRACIRACTCAHVCICVVVDVCVGRYVCMCGLSVHRHVRVYAHVCMHAPRRTTYIHTGGADLPRTGACACACVCGVCTAYMLADSRDDWPCPGAPRPTSSTMRTSVHKHALLTAWASTIAHHVIQCPLT